MSGIEADTEIGELVLTDETDGVLVLTLNRPLRRNALVYESWTALRDALATVVHDTIDDTPPVRAVVIQGASEFFSAGGDLRTGPAHGTGPLGPAGRVEHAQQVLEQLRALPVPVIAAVEGAAVGLGWSLVLACDLVVSSRTAFFAAPFVARAVVPDGGLAWRLTRAAGRLVASDLLLRGRRLPAEEALRYGLVTQLSEPGEALAAACGLAAELAEGEPGAVELTKRLLRTAETAGPAEFAAAELATAVFAQQRDAAAAGRESFG